MPDLHRGDNLHWHHQSADADLPWTKTVAPNLTNSFAVCRPIPSVEPVISTVLPESIIYSPWLSLEETKMVIR